MEQVPVQSAWWRLFALIVLLLLALGAWMRNWFAGLGADWSTVRDLYWLLAPIGLTGFAFGFRLGPVIFWRVYAILFTVEIAIRSMKVAWVPVARLVGWPEQSRHGTGMILFALTCITLCCVALLRHAELVGREAHG